MSEQQGLSDESPLRERQRRLLHVATHVATPAISSGKNGTRWTDHGGFEHEEDSGGQRWTTTAESLHRHLPNPMIRLEPGKNRLEAFYCEPIGSIVATKDVLAEIPFRVKSLIAHDLP